MREDGQAVDDALYSLAMGPDTRVRHYESCVVGDVRYNTLARDEGRKTQNSAIVRTPTRCHIDLAGNTSYHFAASRTVFPRVSSYLCPGPFAPFGTRI